MGTTERRSGRGDPQGRRPRRLARVWADLPLLAKGLVVVAVPVAALVVAAGLYGLAERQDRQAQRLVLRTVEVERQIAQVRILAQTGVTSYLLTGQVGGLNRYRAATRDLPDAIDRLRSLVGDDPAQLERLARVRALAAQRDEVSRALLANARAGGGQASRPSLLRRNGRLVEALVSQLNVMQAEQQRLLAIRQARARRVRSRQSGAIAASVLLGLAGGVGAMLLFTVGVTRRARQLQANAARLADGLPLLQWRAGGDELGDLARGLERASTLLSDRERALREREATLEAVISASPDIITLLDPDGRVRYLSDAMQRVTGRPAGEGVGADALEPMLVHPDDRHGFTLAQRQVLGGQAEDAMLRVRLQHADGHWVVVEAHSRRVGGGGGVVIASRDVSGQVALEEALRQAKAAAEHANQAKSDYLSRMSHELRTPLNAIMGFGQLLELDDLGDGQRQRLRHILSGARHLLDLINEVLDIAAIEAGRLALTLEPVGVAAVVAETISLIRPLADQHRVVLAEPAEPCGGQVLGDRQRLRQILLNLLSNAVKYNREGGSVEVTCAQVRGGRLRVTVTDTGPGIAAESLERLFVPFQRLEATTRAVEGTGLGLALSKGLAEAMGGVLGVESAEGRGSSFWVELPLAERPADRHDARQPPLPPARRPVLPGPALTVLCIEDNLSNLQLVEQLVGYRPRFRLISATRSLPGLDLAAEHRPDLILLDLHLPDLPGEEVLRTLKASPATAATPVVVLTADARPALARQLLDQGARAFLTKPLDVAEFLGVLDAVADELERAGAPPRGAPPG